MLVVDAIGSLTGVKFSNVAQPDVYFVRSVLPSNLGDSSPPVKFVNSTATLALV